jgi:hypothetical protein
MSVKPIAWHEECLYNARQYHEGLLDDLQRLMAKVDALAQQNLNYSFQIDRAKRAGKPGFDRDKYKAGKGV